MTEASAVPRRHDQGALVPLFSAATWRATLSHLLDLPIGIAGFVLVVTGVTLSVGSIPLALVGLVLLALVLTVVRGFGVMERSRARALLGTEVAEPPALAPARAGATGRIRATLTDPVAWRAVAYLLLRLPLGIATFTATVVVWSLSVGLLAAPFMSSLLDGQWITYGPDRHVDSPPEYVVAVLLGLLVLAAAPHVIRGLAVVSGGLVQALLGPTASARIDQLEGQRSSAVQAVDTDRRRIEQDLHDGAQVRLTALAMQLGMAREALEEGGDDTVVRGLVGEAHDQAKQALREIRDLARGIHPAILTDRGLEAALVSMVGRLAVPVDLTVDVTPRPSHAVESIVYFVVAEAVTNAVRHADSERVRVEIVRTGDVVVAEVRDRGRGGADPTRGTGLANLEGRVAAAGGRLTVASPVDVGTLVRAEVPCGS